MSERPRNNKSRTLQGVRQKKKREAKEEAPAELTTKEQIEGAKASLKKEILKGESKTLQKAFDSFGRGVDISILIGFVGMEITRLQKTLDPTEPPTFRYTTALHKYFELMRKLILMQTGSDLFIPEKIVVEMKNTTEGDYSDQPEFE